MTNRDVKRRRVDFGPKPGVAIDEDGDLLLRVGGEYEGHDPVTYRVDSRALARHSPVFKRMLFGGFKEARPADGGGDDGWTVDLPADNPIDFKLFLDIVHGWSAEVPAKTTPTVVAGLVIIAAKYDAISTLRPYAKCWGELIEPDLSEWQNRINDHPWKWQAYFEYIKESLRILFIAWEIGQASIFRGQCLFLIQYIPSDVEPLVELLREQDQQTIDVFESLDAQGIIRE